MIADVSALCDRKGCAHSQTVETLRKYCIRAPSQAPQREASKDLTQPGKYFLFIIPRLGSYFSIYMVIFLNFASYRNAQTCMKMEKPSAQPHSSIMQDLAPAIAVLSSLVTR
jgi:hypothetical protein